MEIEATNILEDEQKPISQKSKDKNDAPINRPAKSTKQDELEVDKNSINIPSEKAYFLQRTQVLYEVQQELLKWAKSKLWLISVFTIIAAFFGIKNITSSAIESQINPQLTKAQEQITRAKVESEKSAELIQKSVTLANQAEKKVSEFSKQIEDLQNTAKEVNNELVSLRSQIEIVTEVADLKEQAAIEENSQLLQKIDETQQLALKTQASNQEKIVVKAAESIPATQEVVVDEGISWENVLNTSWVKPSDIFGRAYFLQIQEGLYVWPLALDTNKKMAEILVNTSKRFRNERETHIFKDWVDVGQSKEFVFNNNTYRINIVDIKRAGNIPSQAVFLNVDKKQ